MARAGKIAISGGVGLRPYVPCGVSIRSLRRYAKPRVAIPSCQEAKRLRENLRSIFKTYALDCANPAPTATERRKTLGRVKNSAAHLIAAPSRRNAYALLDALETRDYHALGMAYRALTANGHEPQWLKRRLRHWGDIIVPVDSQAITAAACALASLNVEALVPMSVKGQFSGFPDPALAHLVAALVPVWERVTGRTVGLFSSYKDGREEKRSLFADWLCEMHALMGLAPPSLWSGIDIVRRDERKTK
jgi:hypothetical protein